MSRLDLDLEGPGRRCGALAVPWSTDKSAYGQLVVPTVVVAGREPGPTVLLVAGVHGDEYEGQIVLAEFARTLDPDRLRGRVVLVPRANPLACRAGRRTSPQDGGNLARLFPGNARGSITAALADAINRHLLPLADAVLDVHAGGSSLDYVPCAWGRLPRRRELAAQVLDLLLAFGGDVAAVVPDPEGGGTLVAAALEQGKPAIAAELGGGGAATPHSLAVTRRGCRRVLAHLGLLEGTRGEDPPLLAVRPLHFLRSPGQGLFEPAFVLGQAVAAGEIAGWLHDPEHSSWEPDTLRFPASGTVICRRVPVPAEPGDVLAHLGEAVDRDALLADRED